MIVNWFTEYTTCGRAKAMVRPVNGEYGTKQMVATIIHGKNHYVFDHFAEYFDPCDHFERLAEARQFVADFLKDK